MDELHKVKVTLMVDFDPEAVNGMAPFEEYVREAGVKGLLPDRWTEDNMEACIKYSVERRTGAAWAAGSRSRTL
jgi:hypothetical protein